MKKKGATIVLTGDGIKNPITVEVDEKGAYISGTAKPAPQKRKAPNSSEK